MEKSQPTGVHLDEGKPRVDLLPPKALIEMAKVMEKGLEKYEAHNWQTGLNWTKIIASLMRHTFAYLDGETLDPETGISHMAHAMCDAAFLVTFETTHPELDDRYVQK